MPRFSLRTLIVVMLLGGPVCAVGWVVSGKTIEHWRQRSQPQRARGYGSYRAIDAEFKWRENPDGSLEGYTAVPPQE
jgi:hypothetical protein